MDIQDLKLICVDTLVRYGGVNKKTIQNGISNLKSGSWRSYKIEGILLLDYDSIPVRTKSKLDYQTLIALETSDEELAYIQKDFTTQRYIELNLLGKIENPDSWKPHVKHVRDFARSIHKVHVLAQKYAFWTTVVKMHEQGNSLLELWNAVNQSKELKKYKWIRYKSYPYFTSLVKLGKEDGIIHVVKNGNFGRPNNERRKLTPWHERNILKLYHDRKIPKSKIASQLNRIAIKKGKPTISQSLIYKFLQQPHIKNQHDPIRYGRLHANNRLFPYLNRKRPDFCDDAWQADGLILPFYCRSENDPERLIRPVLYYIVDVKSGKILSFEIGEEETFQLVIGAFKQAFFEANSVPYEIIIDNSSAVTSKKFENFNDALWNFTRIRLTKTDINLDDVVRYHTPGNPKDKGFIEKVNDILCNGYFRSIRGYLYTMSTNSIERKLDYHSQKKASADPHILIDLSEIIAKKISEYNLTERQDGKSPNQIYINCNKPNSYQISNHDILRITSEPIGTRQVRRGELVINNTKYQFTNFDKWKEVNNTLVEIYKDYHSEKIHIYSSDRYIQSLNPVKLIQAYGPKKRDKAIMGHSQIRKKFERRIQSIKAKTMNTDFIDE